MFPFRVYAQVESRTHARPAGLLLPPGTKRAKSRTRLGSFSRAVESGRPATDGPGGSSPHRWAGIAAQDSDFRDHSLFSNRMEPTDDLPPL